MIKFVKRTTQKFRIDANLRDTFGTRVSGKHKSLVRADPGGAVVCASKTAHNSISLSTFLVQGANLFTS